MSVKIIGLKQKQNHVKSIELSKNKKDESSEGESALGIKNITQKTEKNKKLKINNITQKAQEKNKLEINKIQQKTENTPANDAILLDAEIEENSNDKNKNKEKKYIVLNSVEMLNSKRSFFWKDFSFRHTDNFFCFQDVNFHKQYEKLMTELKEKITIVNLEKRFLSENRKLKDLQSKKGKENEIISKQRELKNIVNDLKDLDITLPKSQEELLEKIKDLNTDILDLHDNAKKLNKQITSLFQTPQEESSCNGYKITRRDRYGFSTNLSTAARYISITTMGLNEDNAIRVRMASGEYLELHLDSMGNFKSKDENECELNPESLADSVIPLTIDGAEQGRMFTKNDKDNTLVYNNYAKVLEDLNQLESLTVNGIDIKENVISAMQYQLNHFHTKQTSCESNNYHTKKVLTDRKKSLENNTPCHSSQQS